MEEAEAVAMEYLFDQLCAELGLCPPADARRRLSECEPRDVDAFVDAVLTAEGLDPLLHKDLRRHVRERASRIAAIWREPGPAC